MPAGRRPFVFTPSRWPVRWRLAGVSAGLTFVILLVFAAGVGRLVQNRLKDDFRSELDATASQIAFAVLIDPVSHEPVGPVALDRGIIANDATVRIVDSRGNTLGGSGTPRPLPPPRADVTTFGELELSTRVVPSTTSSLNPIYVQYARDHDNLDATIGRLWLFLGVGVLAGAILATLAGLWVAGRAMRPIAALTATAREIATTRDPSLHMPEPSAEDEVAELSHTLDSMLEELDAARSESQQMVQAQREFVADASHELRTPLTSILANLELLHERLEASAPTGDEREMVDSALRSSQRMRRLVADLLLLAKADAGRVGKREACDLADVARAALAEVSPVAEEHRFELQADEPVPVRANADDLHRLIVNLLDNALRHTPAGTRVTITVERRDADAILIVADDGPGIPGGVSEQLFARFVRGGGPADVAADAGTGLGLAIVQAVATSHGGTVIADESPHGGARFTVTLPTSAAPGDAEKRKDTANVAETPL